MAKYPGTLLPRLTDPKDSRESRKAVLDLLKKINDTNTTFDSDIETLTDAASYSLANGRNFKNTIINGDFQVWQRGTSFAAIATGAYSADRWKWVNTSAGVVTIAQSTDTPNTSSLWSLQVDVTTADASLAAGDVAYVQYSAEGYDVRRYIGNTFALSFYVKSPKAGIHCVSFRNSVNDRSQVLEYTVNAPNTWEKKTVTVDGGLITTGTWAWTNGLGLSVNFALASGTTFQTTPNAWQTGNFLATANQVNCMDSTANNFFLSQVQLELGEDATEFERRPIALELELCQRYFFRWVAEVAGRWMANLQAYTAGAAFGKLLDLPTTMRVRPTVTRSANADFQLLKADSTAGGAIGSMAFSQNTKNSVSADIGGSSGLVAGNCCVVNALANAWIDCDSDF